MNKPYFAAGLRTAFNPKPSSCLLLVSINDSSIGTTCASATFPSRMLVVNWFSWATVTRAERQIPICSRDIFGGLTSSYIAARFTHRSCAPTRTMRGLSPADLASFRISSINPHCINRHCLARLKFSLSACHFCQYGIAPATKTASSEPTTCIHPDHSDFVMQVAQESIQNKQISVGGGAMGSWLVSMSFLTSDCGSKA